ncbi:MAG: 6-carboxytetrahydropterin synthase QueD [Candidatus Omnitrophota bacterium]|nr:6-carboxytetrahydropterin synthase QueD [Candidatus Omnitrophota bacterium]MDZ4241374.1 6-carboxytetrahydropterin synthase QueD [Candidatus Omnitrophota bacterium]
MFELSVTGHFCSAHALRGYDGPCKNLHGHTWKTEVTIQADRVNDIGLIMDFKEVKHKLNALLDRLDHVNLNDLPAFQSANPSTENLAKHIYQEFAQDCRPFKLLKVRVWESETASVTYYE